MYIFLGNLSTVDICSTSNILPKLVSMLYSQQKTITFQECMTQLYFFIFFTCTEFLLLAVMAYDRYVAICQPLHYPLLMNLKHCTLFLVAVWTAAALEPVIHCVFIANLSFCSSHQINHFFCDISPLLKLSCSDTLHIEIATYVLGAIVGLIAFTLTLSSYVLIIYTIVNIQSADGRRKAFFTCASHLTSVLIFYGTSLSLHVRPMSTYFPTEDKLFSLLYIILIPLANPLIYTLKNKQFKESFQKAITLHCKTGNLDLDI
ncbi:PREDICTED: olfactory receptor 5V1-like [Nanorana parkeri]|uniref:olfactory receptor 5V1-like n=1 Tax=Nanorana parkeri TaxID=125878 RepID=UPI000854EDD4|nr:PREDICTED: olfactory receptor 5V1-like [Nanorana parkeri]